METDVKLEQNLAKIAGFDVSKDSDQPGFWLWVRRENGLIFEGSDVSFESENEAWENAVEMLKNDLFSSGEISEEEWEMMEENDQESLIRGFYSL